MRIVIYDDKLSMRFTSIIKIVFSLLIVSVFVAYAFTQSATRFNEGNRRSMLQMRTPSRYPKINRASLEAPAITPIRSDSMVNGESSSKNFDSSSYLRTPDPRISPLLSKKRSLPIRTVSIPKEEIPEVTPYSTQHFKKQVPIAASVPSFPFPAYREAAPDSTRIRSRIREKEKDMPHVKSFPSTIPKIAASVRDEEKTPQYRVEQNPKEGIPPLQTPPKPMPEEEMPKTIRQAIVPEYKPEQKPEDAPFTNPLLSMKKKETAPEVAPHESILHDERATVSVEEEKSMAEETTVQTSWSIVAVEDKYPLQEEKAQQSEREKKISPQRESSISVDFPKQAVNIQTSLIRGAFIQLASYTKQNDARYAATSPKLVTKLNNVFVYKMPSSQYYKLVVGPFKKDDVGVQLLRLNRKGFSDAFVLKKL